MTTGGQTSRFAEFGNGRDALRRVPIFEVGRGAARPYQSTATESRTTMYDPALPANGSPLVSAEMRGQLNGLKDLIDAIQTLTAVQVDGVNTLPPGDPASVSLSVVGNTLHFAFGIPQGATGADGATGSPGSDGMPGPMGEVSNMDLQNAIDGTSANSNGVGTLGLVASSPPTQYEMQAVADKVDELINALRR